MLCKSSFPSIDAQRSSTNKMAFPDSRSDVYKRQSKDTAELLRLSEQYFQACDDAVKEAEIYTCLLYTSRCV